ncbi:MULTISPECIES: TadE/TadG family type IV pilus assembly protein [Methylobacterium]|uniref:TadE/TadG family type IV pilus assembly protein n=1 Tax=Methylobacterium TaxID=407 RepID=UPI0003459E47|nr:MULTISPECIES: TadE/TadG family type IV pilus assembly protein [Methylobacterium]MBN4093912.1 pilus assembly protein [Methylobacterium sp. OT2]UIN33647.1 pilus assembly protein [Methylobacterium oryzae]SEG10863.1 TadE-like protein [Methylobacterium sp. 190mf]
MGGLPIGLSRFRHDERGIAAVEFALVLPLLIVLYFGTAELTRVVDATRKLTLFARTLSDLSGRVDNALATQNGMALATQDGMTKITSAATAILRPLDASGLQIVVNAMGVETVNGSLKGFVCSSWPQNATKRPANQANGSNGLPATPAAYQFDGARYILAEVTMPYTPIIGSALYRWIFGGRGLTFSRQIPWSERTPSEIVMPGGTACPVYN